MTSERTGRRLIEWTGERCVPWTDDLQVVYEHLHRYHFAAEIRPGGEVLDVGSGEGYGSAILARSAKTVVGIDVDPASIEHSRLNHSHENLRFVQASAHELEGHFPDRSFDLVVCFELIEHVHEQQQLVATMARVLRDDGLLLISTPDRGPYNESRAEANPYHLRELNREEFEDLLREHFPNVSLWGQTAATGSYIGLGPAAAERQRDEWVKLADPDPIYLVAAASRAPLPRLPTASYRSIATSSSFAGPRAPAPSRHASVTSRRSSPTGCVATRISELSATSFRCSSTASSRRGRGERSGSIVALAAGLSAPEPGGCGSRRTTTGTRSSG